MFAPPHTMANNRELLISQMNEIIQQLEAEIAWRSDLAQRNLTGELLKRTVMNPQRSYQPILEDKITDFCDKMNEMAKYAGYQTWELESYIYFQSCTLVKHRSTNQVYRIITGEGLLEFFRDESMAIINLCAL